MIVLRREDVDGFRPATSGLLGWLHSDGVLLVPAELVPAGEVGDRLLTEMQRVLLEPEAKPT